VIGLLLRPWREPATWRALVHVVLDLCIGTVTFLTIVLAVVGTLSSLVFFPLAVLGAWATFLVARILGWVERSRFAALLDVDLADPVAPLAARTWWGRLGERFRSPARWRELAYLVLLFPLGLLTTMTALLAWCGSVALAALPLYVSSLPGGTAKFWLFEVGWGPAAVLAGVIGVVGLVVVAPWLTVSLAGLDRAVGGWLLGRPERDAYEARVSELETSRSAAVLSAEDERRRIERDLHDGAQQRLVALAMDLGVARERLESDPEEAKALVGAAHEEVKAALKELRDLVRGIHPVILEDRGLDAALSSVVARSPVPVALKVEVPQRPSAAVESTAYFVVSEALTNVARHAEATRASVEIARRGDRLVIAIHDDGRGGADPDRGTGLAGLRDRVSALGGWMEVVSPLGGPTTLLVEVPCGS
jgi:signal transduction histidine kinase